MRIINRLVIRLLFISVLGIPLLACDAPDRSSEEAAGSEMEDRAPVDPAESDVHTDTTTSGGLNNQQPLYDTLQ